MLAFKSCFAYLFGGYATPRKHIVFSRLALNNLFWLGCVSTHAIQYNRHIYPIGNCLFIRFPVTLIKPEKPLKVPEVEKFYKLFGSRAVVEFLINTGFTSSCFLGTLLVAFAQIKDFYISVRCSATIDSTCVDRVIEMHFPEFSLYSGNEKCCNPL